MASNILNYLKIIRPNIYDSHNTNILSAEDNRTFEVLTELQEVPKIVIQDYQFQTCKELIITAYGKCAEDKRDIYQYIANLKGNLLVKTWTNGQGQALPRMKNVFDVCWLKRQYNYIYKNRKIIKHWRSSKDHSKFAIAVCGKPALVCIGDLNRTRSQLRRGGGVLCFENNRIWNFLNNMIAAKSVLTGEVELFSGENIGGSARRSDGDDDTDEDFFFRMRIRLSFLFYALCI
ncbi:hypothetical protein B4U80_08705 [Leptotrombidium deliense]|uniref:Uncharacterized protein n=1 Tax=Leptotrombidium deliense TaxID=299467 RepID=A0A443S259_9ACAR|nr:hypothetical protein B4U80_08705 [Leptotrombidium deliense]